MSPLNSVLPEDNVRLRRYAEGFFQRSGKTASPTVRRCARSLGWTQQRVIDAVEGDIEGDMMLTSYHVEFIIEDGDYFVETL